MSEPFVISDDNSGSEYIESYKSISDISPQRSQQYMQQFTTTVSVASNIGQSGRRKYSNKSRPKKGYKRKRIKTLGTAQSTNSSVSRNVPIQRNYYTDDPGFNPSDFSAQWEGISGVKLNTILE